MRLQVLHTLSYPIQVIVSRLAYNEMSTVFQGTLRYTSDILLHSGTVSGISQLRYYSQTKYDKYITCYVGVRPIFTPFLLLAVIFISSTQSNTSSLHSIAVHSCANLANT